MKVQLKVQLKVRYGWWGLLSLGMMVFLLLSACGGGNTSSQKDTVKTRNDSIVAKTPLQLLQSSVIAMKRLKTAHFEMTNVSQITRTTGAASQQGTSVNLKNTGELLFPDQLSMQLTIGQAGAGQSLKLAEIETGQKVYIQNTKNKWFVLDNGAVEAGANPLAGANVSNYNNLLSLAEKADLADNGTENVGGATIHHITATFGNEALHDLLTATDQLNSLPAQQRDTLEQTLKHAKLENPRLHLWIDEATSYVHRMELKFVVNVDTSTLGTATAGKALKASPTPSIMSTSVDTIIDYSKFNEPVKITAPANAVPTTNVSQIFE